MDQSAFILRTTALLLLVACVTDAKVDIIGNPDVKLGEETLLLCKVNGEGEISWQKDREDVDTEEMTVNKLDETSATLQITKIKMSDAGKYTCQVEYDGGHRDEATMTLFVYEGPSFGSTQTYHEFLQGQEGVVPCLVSGQPAVEVQWFRDQKEILSSEDPRVRQASDNSLHIRGATRNDTGSYACQAKIKGRPITLAIQLPISVVINAAPTVRLREEEMTVMSGAQNNVSLLCLVDGSPQPNITWTMPVTFDPSRHQFNSDRSELTIQAVSRRDYGEYACTAKNKVAEGSATIRLHVHEHPEVYLNLKEQNVLKGQRMTVTCNVTGHPQPQLCWINKQNGQTLDSTSGRVQVLDGVLMIDDVAPSDGGLYSCMAVSPSGNASRDIRLKTQPGLPDALSVSPGPTSVYFSLQTPPISGGTPITAFTLHSRLGPADKWAETVVPASDPLVIAGLRPYTSYSVRLAAINTVGVGPFSQTHTVQTQGIQGEPDSPVLSLEDMKIDKNSFALPLRQLDNGGSPLTHYNIRYKDKEGDEWKEMQLSPDATSVSLPELSFGTDYQLEVTAVNANGSSSPAKANFTVGPAPVKTGITKGGVVAIVMVIFLLILIAVDATCCYRNRCGLLMFIAVKLFGHKTPGLKSLEDGDVATNGNRELTLKGLEPHTGSNITQQQSKTQQTEITCDKAPLTKHEKAPHHRDPPATDA